MSGTYRASAPVRLDFAGGWTDVAPFAEREHGVVVNAANEAAVLAFLAGELAFNDIVPACRDVLRHHAFESRPNLDELLRLDRWAREEIHRWNLA